MNKYASSYKEAKERYEQWKKNDPFPSIPSALLNSGDIMDYVRATGMIYPFHESDLHGATYTVRLNGLCVYYTEDESGQIKSNYLRVGDEEHLLPNVVENRKKYNQSKNVVLEPNSITYVTVEPVFQVPNYLALRFNLKISHVYKGLLLGTGPIIDPGFVGRLSIPLHNLTSNRYVLRENDEIISMEVTKMSPISEKNDPKDSVAVSDFMEKTGTYIPTEIPQNRQVTDYIHSALKDADSHVIVSSVIGATSDAKRTAQKAEEKSNEAQRKVKKLRSTLRGVGIGAAITVVIAIAALLVGLLLPTYQLIQAVNETQADYAVQISKLEERIAELELKLGEIDNPSGELPWSCWKYWMPYKAIGEATNEN